MSLTTEHQIQVTEWTFNCLAYLFKYLSRLLTTDLIPTYDLISPLLGKVHQKYFVSRFTAESLSFLVRKCAGDSLNNFVAHAIKDVYTVQTEQFYVSTVLLFAESMKSTGINLHSKTGGILEAIFAALDNVPEEHIPYITDFVSDIYIALLQHSASETAKVLYEKAFKYIDSVFSKSLLTFNDLILPSKLIFALSGLRKGSRVKSWEPLYSRLLIILEKMDDISSCDENATQNLVHPLLQASCALIQSSDLKSVTSFHSKILARYLTLCEGSLFLPFSQLLLEQSRERFKTFAIPFVGKFMNIPENDRYRSSMSYFILNLEKFDLMNNSVEPVQGKLRLSVTGNFVGKAVENVKEYSNKLEKNSDLPTSVELQELWWNLELLRASVSIEKKLLFNELFSIFMVLTNSDTYTTLKASLIGKILSIFSNMQQVQESLTNQVFPVIVNILPKTRVSNDILIGLSNILATLIRKKSENVTQAQFEAIVEQLALNSSLHSTEIRKISLNIAGQLYIVRGFPVPKLLSQCQQIADLPLDLANARNLQMHIRNLGVNFTLTGTEFALNRIIPHYLFGLLTVAFQPVWETAMTALTKVSERDSASVWDIAYSWISPDDSSLKQLELISDIEEGFSQEPPAYREPGCTNLKFITMFAHRIVFTYYNISSTMSNYVQEKCTADPVPTSLRSQAIKVLITIPNVAEKHSRILVPYILWDENEDDEDEGEAPAGASWTFKERTSLLELFSLFKNPMGIHRGAELYNRYLYLLGHRLSHIQQVALKCVFTYKNPTLKKYSENLNALLDDVRFKEECLLLLRKSGEDEETIHEADRSIVLPIVIRILFGRAQVAKSGNSKQGRRFAVLNALMNVEPEYVKLFVSLASDKLHASGFFKDFSASQTSSIEFDEKLAAYSPKENFLRRELGFLTMVEEILEVLRIKARPSLEVIMESIVFSLFTSQNAEGLEPGSNALKSVRSIRQTGAKCLELIFRIMNDVPYWTPYFATIYEHFIKPRLSTFSADNLENPSSIVRLFVTISTRPELVQYLAFDNGSIITAFFGCVADHRVKDAVVITVIDTMTNVLDWYGDEKLVNTDAWSIIVDTGAPIILSHLPHLFGRNSTVQLLDKESSLLVKLASGGHVKDNEVRKQLVAVSINAMERSSQTVSLKIKGDILRCLSALLASDLAEEHELISAFHSLAKMFKQLSDRYARQGLCELYGVFGTKIEKYARIGKLIMDLNAYSTKRINLPDFDVRLDTFAVLNETIYKDINSEEWIPLLYNILFFMKDPEELSIRSNAEYTLRRFVDCISGQGSQNDADAYIKLLEDIVLPAIKVGLRDSNELFRHEFIAVLGHMVRDLKFYSGFEDMKCLTFDGDGEADFFYNVVHIQLHRRQRAVRRLSYFADQLQLRDNNIAHYILPIIEHFVDDKETKGLLSQDTIVSIGSLTRHLSFNQYRAITKRYVSYLVSRPDTIKISVKLVDAVADALGNPTVEKDVNSEDQEMVDLQTTSKKAPFPGAVLLSENLPSQEKLNNFIVNDIVPSIRKVLGLKQEDTLSIRLPLAIPVIKFLKALPHDLIILKIPGVLTTLCQILRSKAQELRNMLRKVLGTITMILGAKYFFFILKELKGALRRGSQLHVLGYTVHYLLVELQSSLQPGDLDDSLEILTEIIMEDTFGATGSEKDADGYTSKMVEVKQHKSYNSGEIVASNITLNRFTTMIEPIKTILLFEKLNLKVEHKIEELLGRYASGLHMNVEAGSREMLVMCYELYKVSQDIEAQEASARKALEEREAEGQMYTEDHESHFIVSLDATASAENNYKKSKLHTLNLHILVKFVFDTVRQVLGKHDELLTVENVTGFIPFIGEGISSPFEDVQISSLRLFTLILRLPVVDVDNKLLSYIRAALEIIQNSPSTNSELCMAALRFISVALRFKTEIEIPEIALGYILERMKPDLDEPDRQGMAFSFVKAVLARGVVIPEVYDIMDRISNVMVTNQTKHIRESCRQVYYQFLTEYPQGNDRLKKQFKFLVNNLQYPAMDGRLSVMELIHMLLVRIDDVHLEDITTSFFVALVLVILSDDSTECKESASYLVKKLLGRAGQTQLDFIDSYILAWLKKSAISEGLLLRGGLQVASLYFSELGTAKNKEILHAAEDKITQILKMALPDSGTEIEWSLVYFAMQLFFKLTETTPSRAFSSSSGYEERWNLAERNLLYPHAWVRLAASRLLGQLFGHVKESDKPVPVAIPTDGLQDIAFKLIRQLSVAGSSEELALQCVKNLVFIGIQFDQNSVLYKKPAETGVAEEEEELAEENETQVDEPALLWLVRRVSSVLRAEKRAREKLHSKRGAIRFIASAIQFSSEKSLSIIQEEIILSCYNLLETTDSSDEVQKEFKAMAQESMDMLKNKIGTTEYLQAYSKVRQMVLDRRIERKRRLAVLAVTEPEAYARKKLKKNIRKRERRKEISDEKKIRKKGRKTSFKS